MPMLVETRKRRLEGLGGGVRKQHHPGGGLAFARYENIRRARRSHA